MRKSPLLSAIKGENLIREMRKGLFFSGLEGVKIQSRVNQDPDKHDRATEVVTEEDLPDKRDSKKHKYSKEDLPELKGFRKAEKGTPKEPNGKGTITLTLNN